MRADDLIGVEIPWLATKVDGKMRMADKRSYDAWLNAELADGEQGMVIVVPLAQDSFHAAAFRFYRNCVLPLIARAMGEANDERAHQHLAEMFLPVVPAKSRSRKRGTVIQFKHKSTSMLTMPCAQFCDFIDRVIAWASDPDELNLRIPLANRRWKLELERLAKAS